MHPGHEELGRIIPDARHRVTGFVAPAVVDLPMAHSREADSIHRDYEAWTDVLLNARRRRHERGDDASTRQITRGRDYHKWCRQLFDLGAPLLALSTLWLSVAPTSGSMGYGLPAAVAAGLRRPEKRVFCFAGSLSSDDNPGTCCARRAQVEGHRVCRG